MSVIICAGCGSAANDEWVRCPECGADPVHGFTEEERRAAAEQAPLQPVEYARRAREAGHPFLQIGLPYPPAHAAALRRGQPTIASLAAAASHHHQLAAIEAEGWELIGHTSFLDQLEFVGRATLAYPEGSIDGDLLGVYLFRAAD